MGKSLGFKKIKLTRINKKFVTKKYFHTTK